MAPERDGQPRLTRDRLVAAALELIGAEGLDGLSMRALADRLDVKAASLYWHVRDRRELLDLLAESILESVPAAPAASGWRASVLELAAALRARVAAQKDAALILLEGPDSLVRSDLHRELARILQEGGLSAAEAADVGLAVMVYAIASPSPDRAARGESDPGPAATLAVDSGSRGVLVRAGSGMRGLVQTGRDRATAAPAIVRGERVVVRRLRGTGFGEIELNPRHAWRFQVQGPTWNTVLDLAGIDVRAVKLDGGAARVECFLPPPRGVVPVEVSGGSVGVALHRAPGVHVAADISSGAVRLKLDDHSIKAAVLDSQWESEPGCSGARDRYQLKISGGAVQVTLDHAMKASRPVEVEPAPEESARSRSALEILLDGVERHVARRS